MSAFHLKLRVLFADGSPAAGLNVTVHENFAPSRSDVVAGQTNGDGRIERDLRDRRQISVPDNVLFPLGPSHLVDDPLDHPTFQITLSDDLGQSNATGPYTDGGIGDLQIRLPSSFLSVTASGIARRSLNASMNGKAPGHVFMMRKDGAVWAEAAGGKAILPRPGQPGRNMTNDTIIHIASMSKPICATALVAMIDDWTEMQADRALLATTPPAKTQVLTFHPHLRLGLAGRRPRIISQERVPHLIAPLYADRARAAEFIAEGFADALPGEMGRLLEAFVADPAVVVTPAPPIPAGHFGLLRRVMLSAPPPAYTDPFLPLIQTRLRATATSVAGNLQIGAGVAAVTLHQLLTHTSPLINGLGDSLKNLPGYSLARPKEPANGRRATFNLWPYLMLLLRQDANGAPGYKNDNYTVLGGVIEACTEMAYDEFVERRLFLDPRFDRIRRRVVAPGSSATYYQGAPPLWSTGNPLPDYTGFSAAGGWYATASQMSDWLDVLFRGTAVAGVMGAAPLITGNLARLFGITGYFSGGSIPTLAPGIVTYQHNGGTGVGHGSVNGKMAVIDGPSGAIHTAFFAGNGDFDAEPPFNTLIAALIANAW